MSKTPFRTMRRHQQQLPQQEAEALLAQGSHGVLSLVGDDGYPYGVPPSYAYAAGKLYFHSATAGHKLDAIASCDKASFCVVAADDVVQEEYTTAYCSVIAFGRIRMLEAEAEKHAALLLLAEKYSPALPTSRHLQAIAADIAHTTLLEFTIEHISGKEGRKLMEMRHQ